MKFVKETIFHYRSAQPSVISHKGNLAKTPFDKAELFNIPLQLHLNQ